MLADGVPEKLVCMIQTYYALTNGLVRAYGTEYSSFSITTGVRQGCPLSPVLFNFATDWTIKQALAGYTGVKLSPNIPIADLEYTDDILVLGEDPGTLQPIIDRLNSCLQA